MIRPDLARFAVAFEHVAREHTTIEHDCYSDEDAELRLRDVLFWEAEPGNPYTSRRRDLDPSEIGERLIEALRREGFVVAKETL